MDKMDNTLQGVAGLQKREISIVSIIAIVYCAVAAGAFGVEEMIQNCGPGMTILFLVVLAFVWALPICFGVSELSSVMPCEGGFYYWTKKSFGEFWGFQVGWWNAVGFHVCGGSYIVLAVNYLSSIIKLDDGQALAIKIGLVIAFALINLMGIKEVGILSTIFSAAVLIAFAILTVIGFAHWNFNPMEPIVPEGMTALESMGNGIGYGIWMYTGWGCITFVAGEIKNVNALPKALLIVVPLIALTYLLPTITGLASVGDWESWTTVGSNEGVGFVTVFSRFVGPAAAIGFLAIAIIGQLSIYNTNIAGGSRIFFVLADDNLFPGVVKNVSKGRGVPYIGVITLSLVSIVLVQFSFTTLILIQVICSLGTYIMMGLSIIKTRKDIPVSGRKGLVLIPGGKAGMYICAILPILVAVAALYLNGTDYFIVGLGFFAITGPVLYVIFKKIYGGMSKDDPVRYPVNKLTGLTKGDTLRMSVFSLVIGLLSLVGSFILKPIEQSWGPEYYIEEYTDAGMLSFLSDFDGMMSIMLIGGLVFIAIAAVLFGVAKKVEDK